MIDLVDELQEVVGLHAMLGHEPAHRGAIALVVVLLDAKRLVLADLEEIRDERADAVVDLLPEIEVVRIERVVEIEHPGFDRAEAAGCGLCGRLHAHAVTNAPSARGPQGCSDYLNCTVVPLLPVGSRVGKAVAVRPLLPQSL